MMTTNNTGRETQTGSPAQKPVLVFYYSDDSIFKETPASNYGSRRLNRALHNLERGTAWQ